MSLFNIHIHSCHVSLPLLSRPPTCMQLVSLTPLSVCGIVTSMSCPSSSPSLSAAACPPAAAPALPKIKSCSHFHSHFQQLQGLIFYNPSNRIRTVTDGHDDCVSGWNGKSSAEPGWDSPRGDLWVSPASLREWDPVEVWHFEQHECRKSTFLSGDGFKMFSASWKLNILGQLKTWESGVVNAGILLFSVAVNK